MFFIGRTRYSLFVPNSESWRLSQGEDEQAIKDYRAELYDTARLKLRQEIFLNHTLPNLKIAAEGFDVTHVVSFSASLPEEFKDALRNAAEEYPFLILDEQADGKVGRSLKLLAKKRAEPGEVFGLYRLDDDDVLATNYFSRMKRFMRPNFAGMVVSFPLGIEAILDDMMISNLKTAHFPMNSMGLMHVCRLGKTRVIAPRGGEHNKADRDNAVVIDSREIGYFRFNHIDQDNVLRLSAGASLSALKKQMARYPDFDDTETLAKLFPTIPPLLTSEEAVSLVEGPIRVWKPLNIPVQIPVSSYSFKVEHNFPEGSEERQALVTFEVVDEHGVGIDDDFEIPGLPKSPKSSIGFYRYLNVVSGDSETELDVALPKGFFLKSITLKRFGLRSKPFIVESVSVRYVKGSAISN
jgi:hypothetical protein